MENIQVNYKTPSLVLCLSSLHFWCLKSYYIKTKCSEKCFHFKMYECCSLIWWMNPQRESLIERIWESNWPFPPFVSQLLHQVGVVRRCGWALITQWSGLVQASFSLSTGRTRWPPLVWKTATHSEGWLGCARWAKASNRCFRKITLGKVKDTEEWWHFENLGNEKNWELILEMTYWNWKVLQEAFLFGDLNLPGTIPSHMASTPMWGDEDPGSI